MENEQNNAEEEQKPTDDSAAIKAAQERVAKANQRVELLKLEEEERRLNKMLGGKSEGGINTVKKEETPREYKDRVMRGDFA